MIQDPILRSSLPEHYLCRSENVIISNGVWRGRGVPEGLRMFILCHPVKAKSMDGVRSLMEISRGSIAHWPLFVFFHLECLPSGRELYFTTCHWIRGRELILSPPLLSATLPVTNPMSLLYSIDLGEYLKYKWYSFHFIESLILKLDWK